MIELEGKTIDVIGYGREIIKSLVVGHDYDIGITIIAENDPDRYLLCMRGPSSSLHKHTAETEMQYKIVFDRATKQIQEGAIDIDAIVGGIMTGMASAKGCPFGQ